MDIPDNMSSRRHISFHSFGLLDVHDGGEKEGFAMLATKVSGYDFVKICEVSLAVLYCVLLVRTSGSNLSKNSKVMLFSYLAAKDLVGV